MLWLCTGTLSRPIKTDHVSFSRQNYDPKNSCFPAKKIKNLATQKQIESRFPAKTKTYQEISFNVYKSDQKIFPK